MSGSDLMSSRSIIPPDVDSPSPFFFPLFLFLSSRSTFSTSSSAFLKSFWPLSRSWSFSSSSSSARRRSRRSLSDSPNRRTGWALARSRRIVSSLEMLKDDSGLGDSLAEATGVADPKRAGVVSLDCSLHEHLSHPHRAHTQASKTLTLPFSSSSSTSSFAACDGSASPLRTYFVARALTLASTAFLLFASSAFSAFMVE